MSIRVSLFASIEESGELIINSQLLLELLNKLNGDEVSFELLNGNTVCITGGVTNFNISVMPGAKYPRIAMPMPGSTVAVSGIPSLIASTVFAASREPIGQAATPQFCCINLTLQEDGIRAAAIDGRRVAQTHGDRESVGNFSMLISATAATTLASLAGEKDVFALGVTGEGLGKTASFYDGTLLFVARIVDGNFPDVDNLYERNATLVSAVVDAKELLRAIVNVAAISSDTDQVTITIGNGKLTLRCATLHGIAEASIDVPTTDAPEVTFHYVAKRVIDCVKAYKGSVTLALCTSGALLMKCGDSRYLQLGVKERVLPAPVVKTKTPVKKAKSVKNEKAA